METDENFAPYEHPLEHAEWKALNRHPRPVLPTQIQYPDPTSATVTILDPPCYGLLDTCFMLRNGWQFMVDITDNYRTANALLDWALEVISEAYLTAITALPDDPGIIVYGDDLGFESGMYLSDLDFRTFLFPRLQTLFARIRKKTNALICFHSCGAISSIIGDIAELGVDILNLDFYAKNVVLGDVRKKLSSRVILHAPVNAAAIGRAVMSNNKASLALLTVDIALSMPSIGGPTDNVAAADEAADTMRGVAFMRAFSSDDLKQIREFGPIKSTIERAARAARDLDIPTISGAGIEFRGIPPGKEPEFHAASSPSSRAILN
ncbi:uroporphyrinogen decarboxylase family protein [Ruegeria sp. 2012CJ15-1]